MCFFKALLPACLQGHANSGACGCLVVLDVRELRIFAARAGTGAIAIGRLVHGLAAQLTEGRFAQLPKTPL